MNRIVRSEHLTTEEAEKYNKIREQVEDEFPPLDELEAPTEGDYKECFWPNAWFISDHGNPVQLHI